METALVELGHHASRPHEHNIPDAVPPAQVIQICRAAQLELITGSRDFVDAVLPGSGRREIFGRVLVFLQDRAEEHEPAIHRLFQRYKRLASGRLYTVTGGRVKVRQLPAGRESPAD